MDARTEHQQDVLDYVREANAGGKYPTLRSATDDLDTRRYRDERWNENEVAGVFRELFDQGLLSEYAPEDATDPEKRHEAAPEGETFPVEDAPEDADGEA